MTLSIPIWLIIPGAFIVCAIVVAARARPSTSWWDMDVVTPLVVLGCIACAVISLVSFAIGRFL